MAVPDLKPSAGMFTVRFYPACALLRDACSVSRSLLSCHAATTLRMGPWCHQSGDLTMTLPDRPGARSAYSRQHGANSAEHLSSRICEPSSSGYHQQQQQRRQQRQPCRRSQRMRSAVADAFGQPAPDAAGKEDALEEVSTAVTAVTAYGSALYRFSRPHTLFGTFVSVCSVSSLALVRSFLPNKRALASCRKLVPVGLENHTSQQNTYRVARYPPSGLSMLERLFIAGVEFLCWSKYITGRPSSGAFEA